MIFEITGSPVKRKKAELGRNVHRSKQVLPKQKPDGNQEKENPVRERASNSPGRHEKDGGSESWTTGTEREKRRWEKRGVGHSRSFPVSRSFSNFQSVTRGKRKRFGLFTGNLGNHGGARASLSRGNQTRAEYSAIKKQNKQACDSLLYLAVRRKQLEMPISPFALLTLYGC